MCGRVCCSTSIVGAEVSLPVCVEGEEMQRTVLSTAPHFLQSPTSRLALAIQHSS
jgi:hypothetical protein